ncbi:MAG TPA: outer membrane beta-barrel protein [Xanthobacteraceae bacterium]|nr:outer membrane beta-barrel protein [Xanthobacteraceae bacterium]
MKKILGGLVISALLAAPAMAADMRMPVKAAPAPIVTVFSWTGCYIGGHVGYAWGKKNVDPTDFVLFPGFSPDHDIDGFIAGGQVGCNLWQSDRWVLGIEGQASWADLDGSVGPHTPVTAGYNGFRTDADVIGSIAARLGYAFGATGQTLIFVKGGAAFIHEQFFTTGLGPATFNTQSDKDLRWGWMVGAGIEQALSSNWSLKAEYNYSNFGTHTLSLCNAAGACDDWSIKQHVHLVKFGINYRFGGPVVARY